jgi:hnRNP-L/PTB/hephaestus splicing factor
MENGDVAQNMVNDCMMHDQASLRQRMLYVQFSDHEKLKTDESPQQMKVEALLQAMQQQNEGGTNHVLRVVVENLLYPITLDVLHTIFSKFGVVLKAITFNKNNQFQALIQMGDAVQSQTAKLSLDGQNIYNGCCTLRIDYSKLPSLNVKYNNDKSRDYTRSDLPSGDSPQTNGILNAPNSQVQSLISNPSGIIPSPAIASQAASLVAALQPQYNPFSQTHTSTPVGSVNQNVAAQIAAIVNGGQRSNSNAVVHVSNLNEEAVTPRVLFVLFGVYGDVIRVKILFQKKSNALVQMNDDQQAQLVIKYLHGVRLFGRNLQVVLSKHSQVQMPREGQDVENLTNDYTNSSLHRFKKPGSKNYLNIFPPSDVLHLSNIPPEVTEDALKEAFSKHAQVKAFKFFAKDHRMALIQLYSIDDAVTCLIMMHNYKLTDTYHLRVSFSKGHI